MTKINRARVLFFGFLLLGSFLVFFVYWPPYADSFYRDDFKHFEFISGFIAQPLTVYRILDPFWIFWFYRPVVHFFFLASQLLFGFTPPYYYALLIVGHVTAGLLLYILARRLKVGIYGALFAVSLFTIHATHTNTVGWISAVSIVVAAIFLLAAVICFLNYLANPYQAGWIVAVMAFYILALLSREESLVLPLLLLFVRWAMLGWRRISRTEFAMFLTLIVISAAYISIQFLGQSSARFDLDSSPFSSVTEKLANSNSARNFIVELFSKSTSVALSPFDKSALISTALVLLATVMIFVWYWRGKRATRIGLVWALLILLFLYLSIWRGDGSLFGRYFYLPWIGISLALGATIEVITNKIVSRRRIVLQMAFIFILVAFLLSQVNLIRSSQKRILSETDQYERVRKQLLELLPTVTSDTHIFAYRMPFIADHIQAMSSVYYGIPLKWPGGALGRLKKWGRATNQFYLFDYQDGTLVNLMPELQEHSQTYFLWSQDPEALIWREDGTSMALDPGAYQLDQLAGPESSQRLAIFTHPPAPQEGWASLAFSTEVPNNSQLHFGIYKDVGDVNGEDGMAFRVRVQTEDGSTDALFHTFWEMPAPDTDTGWEDIEIQMQPYWGQTVTLYFEVAAGANLLHDHGYWAIPRLVVDK